MALFIRAYVIACCAIFLLGIIAHVNSVLNEKWTQNDAVLVKMLKESRKRFILSLIGLAFWPLLIPFIDAIIGEVIPLVILIVIFFEVCFSLLVVSQGHRALLINRVLRKRKSNSISSYSMDK